MSRIAFIAPDKALFLQGQKIVHELGLTQQVDFHLARLNRAIKLAKSLEHGDVDVIICRGGTAHLLIQSQVRIPVVEIPITGQDLAQVFHDAKQLTGVARPKIAILAFKNMIYDIEVLSRILDVDLTIYPLETVEDIPRQIRQVCKSAIPVVVGGSKTVSLATQAGLQGLPIRSGDFSVRSALLEAQKIILGRKYEKEQALEFTILVNHSTDGIISVNSGRIIKIFNPTAERLLHRTARQVLGQPLDLALPFLNIDSCLKEGKESVGQAVQFGSSWLNFNITPILVDQQSSGAIITFQDITRIQEMEAKIRNEVLARRLTANYHFTDILGTSPQMGETRRMAQEIAAVDATVLLYGESGTGKELFAQSIHNQSPRRNGPFVAVNCAALPANLLESELFGYVEGAFTGATKKGKQGLFEMAHRGTLFLDEISEMDKYAQSRLLRVLQEKQVMRLGDDKYIPVDVRIIAATNKNLRLAVQDGLFRQDLYYRLKVLTLNIPPLRSRNGDIRILTQHFLSLLNRRYNKSINLSDDAYAALESHDWPGNVRELLYFIERLVVISQEKQITHGVLCRYWEDSDNPAVCAAPPPFPAKPYSEADQIRQALAQTNSNISHAAAALGMDRSTLYRKLKLYQIEIQKKY